jgi:hypothetical protein
MKEQTFMEWDSIIYSLKTYFYVTQLIASAHWIKLKPLYFNMLNVLYDDQKLMIIVISIFLEFQNKKDSCN